MKRVNLRLFLMALALPLAMTFNACSPGEDPIEDTEDIKFEDGTYARTLTFAFDDTTSKSVNIESNRKWTADVKADWVKVEPANGEKGKAAVTVSVTGENSGTEARTTSVIFNNGSKKPAVLTVTQLAKGQTTDPEGHTVFTEDFESGAINGKFEKNGWTNAAVTGSGKSWVVKSYENNKYAEASAHNGKDSDYEFWLMSPALDIAKATDKTMQFSTKGGYFKSTSSLEVYVMDKADPTGTKTKLENVRIVLDSDLKEKQTYTDWIPTGKIDLSAYSGIKYIGFRYVAKGGASNSTSYQVDNFVFGRDGMPTTFGEPALTGIFMKDTTIEGAKITIPYQNAKGTEKYSVNVVASGTAAAGFDKITKEITLPQGNGTITIDITGKPTTEGDFTLTISGIEGLKTTTVTGTVQPKSASPNLLQNHSFETVTGTFADGWQHKEQVSIVSEGAQDGKNAVKLNGLEKFQRCDVLQDIKIENIAGKTYEFSYWYKDNTNNDNKGEKGGILTGTRIWSGFIDAAGKLIDLGKNTPLIPDTYVEQVTTWTEYKATGVAPENAVGIRFEVRTMKGNSALIDNCAVRLKE